MTDWHPPSLSHGVPFRLTDTPPSPHPPPSPPTSGWEREIKPKAIEPLQRFLNEGMQDRKITDLFGPKQYVHIYTYVPVAGLGVVFACVGPFVVWWGHLTLMPTLDHHTPTRQDLLQHVHTAKPLQLVGAALPEAQRGD